MRPCVRLDLDSGTVLWRLLVLVPEDIGYENRFNLRWNGWSNSRVLAQNATDFYLMLRRRGVHGGRDRDATKSYP